MLDDPKDVDNMRMDPPVLTKSVISEGFDIADETAPGCLEGDPLDTDVI